MLLLALKALMMVNKDSIGVTGLNTTGLGWPAGNDVGGNAFTFSSVFSLQRELFDSYLVSTWLSRRAFAMTASASSSLNFNITRSRGISACATGKASALPFAATILPPRFV